jgi:hypothetical protein
VIRGVQLAPSRPPSRLTGQVSRGCKPLAAANKRLYVRRSIPLKRFAGTRVGIGFCAAKQPAARGLGIRRRGGRGVGEGGGGGGEGGGED